MRLRALFSASALVLLTSTAQATISVTPVDEDDDDAGDDTTLHVETTPVPDGGTPLPVRTQPASRGVNLAGGADGDNCAVRGVGAPASGMGAAALALALAFSLTRRRRG